MVYALGASVFLIAAVFSVRRILAPLDGLLKVAEDLAERPGPAAEYESSRDLANLAQALGPSLTALNSTPRQTEPAPAADPAKTLR